MLVCELVRTGTVTVPELVVASGAVTVETFSFFAIIGAPAEFCNIAEVWFVWELLPKGGAGIRVDLRVANRFKPCSFACNGKGSNPGVEVEVFWFFIHSVIQI